MLSVATMMLPSLGWMLLLMAATWQGGFVRGTVFTLDAFDLRQSLDGVNGDPLVASSSSSLRRVLAEVRQPLFRGQGTHYVFLWVGSPPQRVSVIVDTGSHHTAFPCVGCQCGKHVRPTLFVLFCSLLCFVGCLLVGWSVCLFVPLIVSLCLRLIIFLF
jgi:hypothetical protein